VTLALDGPRVVLSTAGVVEVWDVAGSVSLRPGRAAYVSAGQPHIVIGGEGTAFVVGPGRWDTGSA